MWVECFHSPAFDCWVKHTSHASAEEFFPYKILISNRLLEFLETTHRSLPWPEACFNTIVGMLVFAPQLCFW